jgi:hypothetical protein
MLFSFKRVKLIIIIATSNAPTRRKRRISSTEPETTGEPEQGKKKKIRGDSESKDELENDDPATANTTEKHGDSTTPEVSADNEDAVQREGSVEVKSVTDGVKEVELDDKPNVTEDTTSSHAETENAANDVEAQSDTGAGPVASATQGDVVVYPESIPLPEEDDELDDLASSSPSSTKEDSVVSLDETTTDTPIEASRETITEDSTNTSSPGKRSRTRASASPRKLPSQSPQKLFTTV